MASPEELAPLLPETLPENFSEWDGESSPEATPVPSGEWEAWEAAHSFRETPKPLGRSVSRDETKASSGDRPRVSGSASSAPVVVEQQVDFSFRNSEASPSTKPVNSREEWEAWIEAHSFGETPKPFGQSTERKAIVSPVVNSPRASGSGSSAPVLVKEQEPTSEPEDRSPSRVSRGPDTSRAANEAPAVQGLPKVATVDGARNSAQPATALKREAEEALFQWYSSKDIEVKGEQKTAEKKTAKKKWLTIAAASASSILLLLMIPLFYHGSKSVVKPSVQPVPAATDTQQETQEMPAPNPPAGEPLTQDKPLATTEQQPATDNQPAAPQERENSAQAPTKLQAKVMDDQLTAPTLIPQGNEKQVAENAPPPVIFGGGGADGLGGGSANVSVLNGQAQPAVKVVSSKPFTISSGVAAGMLILKTQPTYPSIAKAARVSGTVELHATISKTGTIKNLQAVNGPAMLKQAALDAVRNWRYKPYMLNNQPTEVETTIKLIFALD